MFRDRHVLDDEVVPERELVVHRREELDALLADLVPDEQVAGQVYLTGPPGSGKTMLARLSLSLLQADHHVTTAYINCWEQYEGHDLLYELATGLRVGTYHRTATPRQTLIEDLQRDVDTPRLVALDEVDQLADTEVLYTLHSLPNFRAIYIANDEEQLFHALDDRIQSRVMVGGRHHLQPYSVEQLTAILRKRAEFAFVDAQTVIDRRHLETIAAAADGDARLAILVLRLAAERAADNDARSIDESAIETAIPSARARLRRKSIDQLHDHQRVLYEIIKTNGPLAPSEIYDAYSEAVGDSRSERTVRRYLTKLEQYNLIESRGRRTAKTYSARPAES